MKKPQLIFFSETPRRKEYYIYKSQWQSITPEQEKHFGKFRSRKGRVGSSISLATNMHELK
jgi:hypothetical protein